MHAEQDNHHQPSAPSPGLLVVESPHRQSHDHTAQHDDFAAKLAVLDQQIEAHRADRDRIQEAMEADPNRRLRLSHARHIGKVVELMIAKMELLRAAATDQEALIASIQSCDIAEEARERNARRASRQVQSNLPDRPRREVKRRESGYFQKKVQRWFMTRRVQLSDMPEEIELPKVDRQKAKAAIATSSRNYRRVKYIDVELRAEFPFKATSAELIKMAKAGVAAPPEVVGGPAVKTSQFVIPSGPPNSDSAQFVIPSEAEGSGEPARRAFLWSRFLRSGVSQSLTAFGRNDENGPDP